MPEFAEVNIQVQYLRDRCRSWKIADWGTEGWSHFKNLDESRKDDILKDFFKGATLQEVTQRGKHVVLRFDSGILSSHLMFKGRWSFADDPFISNYKQHKNPPTAKSNTFWVINEDGERLNFHDPEYKGRVTAYPGVDDARLVPGLAKLGPEVLVTDETDPSFSEVEWDVDVLAGKAGRTKRAIKVLLLDQEAQAGLGNMYVCEALYRAQILPQRASKELDGGELEGLVDEAKSIVRRAIDSKLDYGELLQIYRKDKDPEGRPVKSGKVGGRDTFWVEDFQR